MSVRPREAPPLPVPGPDPRVLERVLGGIVQDPEDAITGWIGPLVPRRRPGRPRRRSRVR